MKSLLLLVVLALLAGMASSVRGQTYTDGTGKLRAIVLDGQPFDVQVGWSVFAKNWGSNRSPNPWNDRRMRMTNAPEGRMWTGQVREGGTNWEWSERLREQPSGAQLMYRFTPEAKSAIEGVFVMIDVPHDVFAGGQVKGLGKDGAAPVALPAQRPAGQDERHISAGTGKEFTLASADGKSTLAVTLDRPCYALLQFSRVDQRDSYQLMVRAVDADAAANAPVALTMTLQAQAPVDTQPIALQLGAADAARPLKGLGGNYCFSIQSPVTQYTLKHLPSAWARHEIRMTQWGPRSPADKAGKTNRERLVAADTPGSELHEGFLVAQELTRRKIPLVFSLWRPGAPFFVASDQQRARGTISDDGWPFLLDAMVDYVKYAKDVYGVEPALISTNESDAGVDVHLTADEEHKMVLDMGQRLHAAQLNTKFLLGDISALRKGPDWMNPTLADPTAMQYVGAIGLHNWGDGTHDDYMAWHDVSAKARLPLLITEFGADANWRMVSTQGATFYYGLDETRILLQALAWARPETVLYWEYTGDYALVHPRGDEADWSKRAVFWRQVATLTPTNALPRDVTTDAPRVVVAAYQGQADPGAAAVHVVNLGAERQLTVSGLQAGLKTLHAYVTDPTRELVALPDVTVNNGQAQLTLPAQSLVTLTSETFRP